MKYVKIFTDFLEDIESLNPDEVGRLFISILEYSKDGTEQTLTGNERFLWGTARKQINAQKKSYEHQCEVNKKNRHESSRIVTTRNEIDESLQEQEQEQDKEQEHKGNKKRFAPPTYEDVQEYCSSSGLNVDAYKFVDFYASKNWLVGKSKMKDWKAAARNWSRSDIRKGNGKASNYAQRTVTDADFQDLFLNLGG